MNKDLFILLIIYLACVVFAGLLWTEPYLLALVYLITSLFMFLKWHTKNDIFYYFSAFLLGPVGEVVAIYFGAWEYSKPLFLIPIWLPPLWGIASLFMIKFSQIIIETNFKK